MKLNMNKIVSFSFLLLTCVLFSACVGEEADKFDQSAAERLNAASSLYSQHLEVSPNGWAMQLYPTTEDEAPYGNGYLVLCDFNADGSVRVAMNNALTDNVYKEDTSAWEVITDDGPVLSFNSYNKVMHLFSDPNDVSSTSDDETGTGIGGDYEFIIVKAPDDGSYMMLKGKKRGTYNLLTPMESGVDWSSYLEDVRSFQSKMFPTDAPTFDIIHLGDSIYKMDGASDGIPNIYPYDADAVMSQSFNPFLITKRGDQYYLRFRDSIRVTTDSIVQDFHYNTDKDIFESVDNAAYYISGDSPLRFFNQELVEESKRWQFSRSASMSSSMQTLCDDVYTAFSDLKAYGKSYTLQSMALMMHSGQFTLRVSYKYPTSKTQMSTSNVYYIFDYTKSDGGITLQYQKPEATADATVLNALPALQTFLTALSKSFTVTAATTAFDLNQVKLTASDDTTTYLCVTLY